MGKQDESVDVFLNCGSVVLDVTAGTFAAGRVAPTTNGPSVGATSCPGGRYRVCLVSFY